MVNVPVRADFLGDVREQLAKRLTLSAIPVPADMKVHDVAIRYFDFKRRQIPACPRTVLRSRELDANALSPEHQAGVEAIIEDAMAGRTLLPYLTKDWLNLDLHDYLFNDWRILHLHLGGRRFNSAGFVERTQFVLFAFPTHDALYLIDVMDHNPTTAKTAFAKKQLVQILHNNWPFLLEPYLLHGVSELHPNGDEARWALSRRRKGDDGKLAGHAMIGVELKNGHVYDGMGGGYTMTGLSAEALDRSNHLLNAAHRLQKHWVSKGDEIREKIMKGTGLALAELHLRLDVQHMASGVQVEVRETRSNLRVRTTYPRGPTPDIFDLRNGGG